MSCGVGHRHGLDPLVLWLWRRPAAAAPIRTLAWERPYALGAVLKRPKKRPGGIKVCLQVVSNMNYGKKESDGENIRENRDNEQSKRIFQEYQNLYPSRNEKIL